jgi:CBS domain-containing protein
MPDTRFKPLPWTRLQRGVPCYLPKPVTRPPVDAQSPALAVMTDLQRVAPVTIARDTSLEDANRIMLLCHTLLSAGGR